MPGLISLCMIVKNEESVLQRCLESVKDGVDEIVIVDTGSTDKTKEIAKQYTDKVYDYKWNDSFSEARNFAQSKATSEWILALDADEFVDHQNLLELRDELKENKNDFNMCVVKIYNFAGRDAQTIFNNYHVRIYKNDPAIKYYRAIHEQLKRMDGKELRSHVSRLVVYHSGYLSYTVATKNKGLRNRTLINKEIKVEGQTGFDYFNLGNELVSQGKTERALDCYVKAYQKAPNIKFSWVGTCLIQICQCLVSLKRYQDTLNVIRDSEAIFNSYPDFKAIRGRVYFLQGRLDDALHELKEIIENQDKYQEALLSTDSISYLPNKWIGEIYEEKKDLKQAVMYYSKAFHDNRNDVELLTNYFGLLFRNSSFEELSHFFNDEKLLSGNEVNDLFLLKVILNFPESNKNTEKFIFQTRYIKKVDIKAKCLLINGKPAEALEQINQLPIKQRIAIFNIGVFDFSDYIIASLLSKQQDILISYGKQYKNTEGIINLLITGTGETDKDLPVYLTILERTICLQQFGLFEQLLDYRRAFDKSANIQIGHLLYHYHFNDLAVQFYQEAGKEQFDEQTYLNLINESKKNRLLEAAYNFSNQAVQRGFYHFQILKSIGKLAHQMRAEKLELSIQQLALKCYPDSHYLSEKTIWGEIRNKVALVYTPLSGSNITALVRQIPDEVKWRYQVNLIEQKNDLNYFNELLKNDVVVTTEGNYPFQKKSIQKEQKVIELWHGFPLKSMGLMDESEVGKEKIENQWVNVDAVVSYSNLYNQSMKKCFGIAESKFKILGVPRNDFLLRSDGKNNIRKMFHINNNDRFIFYMPTWRHTPRLNRNDGNRSWKNLFDIPEFNSERFEIFLKKHHYKLIVKLHPADERMFINRVPKSENILILSSTLLVDHQLDIYELLSGADLLITDYSSVYFDFLLLNKPIIFTPVDLESYQKTRGLILKPYEKWTPGPKVTTQHDLEDQIVKSMTDVNYFSKERENIKNIVHEYQDDHSTERVWKFIRSILEEE
ncbi:CDP-glycerol glycerophosphotransferase family protein [Sporolactobacillus vineae]|uniref:CDP-glycerol glycerophosphotransferase family protein n=1 Tax=Sporolactobacillus vineae TaxID=444463 RepID=UPI0002899B9A|nr:CDP-glycerol glycerophosphotransferase family protein [Sporolactobacillus vineae]